MAAQVGCGIWDDAERIQKQFKVAVNGCFDLSEAYEEYSGRSGPFGLSSFTESFWNISLNKRLARRLVRRECVPHVV